MERKKPFVRCLCLPETRSAFLAVETLCAHFRTGRPHRAISPLVLHGPAGVGKSQLVAMLARAVSQQARGCTIAVLPAGDFQPLEQPASDVIDQAQARHGDLWIVEDLQHLPVRAAEAFVQVLEYRLARRLPTVVTAHVGPRQLAPRPSAHGSRFPARLTSRLAAGLVVALGPWQAASRLLFLEELAQSQQLAVEPGILKWLADNLPGSGRVLSGALQQLETLARQQRRPLDLATVKRHFADETAAHQPTVERIVQHVSGYFRTDPELLQSSSRFRSVMLPRQISMYLARKLTALSLEQIGAYFGGRDHTTVLHACRKMEHALQEDPVLSGTVQHLHAQLT